ncbi:50S ribosomal protein L35 [Patescibacteria group bacterium]|jgi:large subunit ribosomal protein L35|nr:50S ribosomal protein L35 [Patescibacteria group bacterium]
MAMKTYKALAKRVKITKSGKVTKRKAGQDHFNSRESGNTTRNKRTDITVSDRFVKTVKALLPYSS